MMDQSIDHAIQPDFGEARLDALQRHAFAYFLNETNAANGLVADRTQTGAPASIAAVGFALAAYPVGVERGWMTRTDAIERTPTQRLYCYLHQSIMPPVIILPPPKIRTSNKTTMTVPMMISTVLELVVVLLM